MRRYHPNGCSRPDSAVVRDGNGGWFERPLSHGQNGAELRDAAELRKSRYVEVDPGHPYPAFPHVNCILINDGYRDLNLWKVNHRILECDRNKCEGVDRRVESRVELVGRRDTKKVGIALLKQGRGEIVLDWVLEALIGSSLRLVERLHLDGARRDIGARRDLDKVRMDGSVKVIPASSFRRSAPCHAGHWVIWIDGRVISISQFHIARR